MMAMPFPRITLFDLIRRRGEPRVPVVAPDPRDREQAERSRLVREDVTKARLTGHLLRREVQRRQALATGNYVEEVLTGTYRGPGRGPR